jgi:predicted phage tail protein
LLALEITAGEQLQTVPSVSVDVCGLAELRVWDGESEPSSPEFDAGYSDNPADLALELITNAAWGMGAVYGDDAIDFESLLEWREYCAELVDRPGGGSRPRFRFGMALDKHEDGVDWLRRICGAGRCVPVTVGGVWRFIVDRPRDVPAETFTDGSIAVGDDGAALFTYRREYALGGLARPNQFVAQFLNEAERGKPDTLEYPKRGDEWLATESPRPEDLRLDGVTDPDQVASELVYRANRSRLITRSVSFTTTKPVVVVQPGERFDLAMSLPGYGVASGRVLEGSAVGAVRLDRDLSLDDGVTYRVRVIHLDNSIEVAEIAAAPGELPRGSSVGLASDLAQAPASGAEYAIEIEAAGVTVRPFVCTGVRVADTERFLWEVSGVEYVPEVFGDEAAGVDLPGYTTLDDPLAAPGPVRTLSAFEQKDPASGDARIVLAWEQGGADAAVTSTFRVYRRTVGTATWVLTPTAVVARRSAQVDVYQPDRGYQFVVVPVSVGGTFLSPYDTRHPRASIVLGLAAAAPPAPASGSATRVIGNRWSLSWDAVEGASAYVVHGSGDSGNDALVNNGAAHALTIARPSGASVELELSRLAERFYVRAVGANGRMSTSALKLDVTNTTPPSGTAAKSTVAVDFAGSGTLDNATAPAGVFTPTDPADEASWVSGVIDTGGESLTTVVIGHRVANLAADPVIAAVGFLVPSVEADQWGVVGPSREVGMLFPPAPDDRVAVVWEVSIDLGGGVYSDWIEVARGASYTATFRYCRARVRVSRTAAPYAAGITAAQVEFYD